MAAIGATRFLTRGLAALLLALVQAACSSLPSVMEAERAAIDAQLEAQGEHVVFGPHLRVVESINQAPLVPGNATRVLVDGPEAYAAIFAAIGAARDHIHIESFIFEELEFGQRLSDLLIAKQRAGVEVRILYDSIGSLSTPSAFFERLREHGICACEFNPVNPLRARLLRVNHRDHRKIVIADGTIAFTGGINFHGVYRSGSMPKLRRAQPTTEEGWRDTHLEIRGPAVHAPQRLFLDSWRKQDCTEGPERTYFPPVSAQGDETIAVIGSSPDGMLSRMYLTLLSAIGYARHSIYVTAAYFAPDPATIAALQDAARRGVDVRLLLPGITDSGLVLAAGRSHYAELLAAGVRVYERHDALLHAKTVVIDGVWSTIGSSNIDWRSFCHNDEVNALVFGEAFGARMTRLFHDDLAAAIEIERDRWAARSTWDRTKEWFARRWDYLL
jgi:cardiolipin synthase